MTPYASFPPSGTFSPIVADKHVVFGRVVEGASVYQQMERVVTGAGDKPKTPVTIADCGQLTAGQQLPPTTGLHTGVYGGASSASQPAPGELSTAALARSLDPRKLPSVMEGAGLPTAFGARGGFKRPSGQRGGAHEDTRAAEASLAEVIKAQVAAKQQQQKGGDGGASAPASAVASSGKGLSGLLASVRSSSAAAAPAGIAASSASASLGTAADSVESADHSDAPLHDASVQQTDESVGEGASGGGGAGGDASVDAGDAGEGEPAAHNPLADRLASIRARLGDARASNRKEVTSEARRIADPAAEKRARHAERLAGEQAAKHRAAREAGASADDGEEEGGSSAKRARTLGEGEASGSAPAAPAPAYLHETADQAAGRKAAEAAKAARMRMAHGWNRYSADAQAAAYERRLGALPTGGPPAAAAGALEDTASSSALAYGSRGVVNPAGVEALVEEIHAAEARRTSFYRHKALPQDGQGINAHNVKYTAKLGREMDPYSVDIKQALERGTAL